MTYFFYYPRSKSLNASFERWIVLYSIMPANMLAFYLHFHADQLLEVNITSPHKSNDYIFESMLDNLKYQSSSQYFRDLVTDYLTYPQYKREQIIFKDTVEIIKQAITNQKQIKLHLDKDVVTINPYRLDTSKEELYTYLIGIVDNKPYSINISKINSVIRTPQSFKLLDEQIKLIDDIIENGIQFPYTVPCNAIIKLNKIGKRMYERRYLHRPPVKKIDGDNYYFSCGFDQLLYYFLAFGKNALVVSPQSLVNNMKYEHLNAYKQYNKTL